VPRMHAEESSEVAFVIDSMAGDTEVPDSQDGAGVDRAEEDLA